MRISFANIDGIKTRYLHEGSGAALLLIHGVGMSGDMWLRNIDPLAEHWSVYAPDLLGHGFTDTIDLNGDPPQPHMVAHLGKLMDAVGADRYSIAGSSYGALLAALMYFDRPERVDKLILVGSGSAFHPPDEQEKTLKAAAANAATAMGDPTLQSCRSRMANICYDPASVAEELLLNQLTSYALPNRFDFYQATIAGLIATVGSDVHRVYTRLEKIEASTLIITGREDIRSSWELTELAHQRMPVAELHVFEKCGHMPMSEHPVAFNDLVANFLQR